MGVDTFPFQTEKVYSGVHGKLIDANGLMIQETAEFTAKVTMEYEDVIVAGSRWKGRKLKGMAGTGTLKLKRISATLRMAIVNAAQAGAPFITQLVGEVGNDLGETETVLLQNVKFEGDVDLVKFTAQDQVEDDLTFSFTGYKPM